MKKIGLCIGINKYGGFNELSGCVNDANDLQAALEKRDFDATTLLDRDATGENIRDGIEEILSRTAKGDLIVLTYSGHGSYVPDEDGDEEDGLDEVICPVDIDRDYITDDELFLYGIRARELQAKMVLLSDSCHSGTVMRFVGGKPPPEATRVRFLPPQNFLSKKKTELAQKAAAFGVKKLPWKHAGLLISGCQDTEYSYDAWFKERPNGAFTYHALKALNALPAKGGSYTLWHKNIRKLLPTAEYPQSPNITGPASMKRLKALA